MTGPDTDLLAIARALCGVAAAGNVQGIRELADRLDGKVPQALRREVLSESRMREICLSGHSGD